MSSLPSASTAKWLTWLGPALIVLLFGLPLFVGLGRWDLRNDEAIYSYAVDRMVETGDWITPRSIPFDNAFLEKPPLKFWIVSAAIRAGLLPKNEVGFRFFDALFGACAFLYVYALARRLVQESGGSPVACVVGGLGSVLTLFTIDPLLFDHGLRSNNMEAALVLAYTGGLYHFTRWTDGARAAATGAVPSRDERRRRRHALIVGAYFVLGFMTKFVAVLFLPIVCLLAFAGRRDAWRELRRTWTDWLWAALLVVALVAPWFVLAYLRHGRMLWQIMFGLHVVTRFTASLDPHHVRAWHFYYTETWTQLRLAGSALVVSAGLVLLTIKAWRGDSWLARLLTVWWVVPVVLISIGTSKLFHYVYPFLPPIAIAAGLVAAQLYSLVDAATTVLPARTTPRSPSAFRRVIRPVLAIAGAFALVIATWNVLAGSVHWWLGGVELFRNSSTFRPLVLGTLLLWLGGYPRPAAHVLGVLAIASLLPTSAYRVRAERTMTIDHPLHAMRDCTHAVQVSPAERVGHGVYNGAAAVAHQSYNYYFGRLGPWVLAASPDRAELLKRVFGHGRQTPVVLSTREYYDSLTLTAPASTQHAPPPSIGGSVRAIIPEDGLVVLLPESYATCADAAVAAGGRRADDVTGRREDSE